MLFRLLYGESEDLILGPTWKHDFLYKNRGVIHFGDVNEYEWVPGRHWRYVDPQGLTWWQRAGVFSRAEVDETYREEMRDLGYSAFAWITWVVNRLLGWVFWYDVNEFPKCRWRRIFG